MNNPEEMSKGMTPNLPLWSYQLQQNSKLAVKTRKDLEVHLITRALKDEGFKQELLANPKAIVEKEISTKLPESVEIQVLEETETTFYMVLPSNPYKGLSELELKTSLGITYEDVALWVLEQQRNTLVDEALGVALMARSWKDEAFKQNFLRNPVTTIEELQGENVQEKVQGITIQVMEETANTLFLVLPKILISSVLPIEDDKINIQMVIGASASTDQDRPVTLCTTNAICCNQGCRFLTL